MGHTDKTAAQLRAEIAEREAALAAMEAEPDYEAWRPDFSDIMPTHDDLLLMIADLPDAERAKLRHLAALPLAPAEPVDEAWIEAKAWECVRADAELDGCLSLEAAIMCVRSTLAHVGGACCPCPRSALGCWRGCSGVGGMDDLVERLRFCPNIEHARILMLNERVPECVVPISLRDEAAETITAAAPWAALGVLGYQARPRAPTVVEQPPPVIVQPVFAP